jgi:hypothetical protein
MFIYVNRCAKRFPYQMLLSFNSKTMGVTCGAGTAYPSEKPEIIPILFYGIRVIPTLVFYVSFS